MKFGFSKYICIANTIIESKSIKISALISDCNIIKI